MPQVITRFHNLRRIDMMGCYMVTAPVIEKFCAAKVVFKRMESINMEALPELKDKAVSKLARITPKLKELSIAKCQRITDRGLEAVATGCPDLVTLNVNYDSKVVPIGAPGVVWPPSGLSKLRAINLRGCANLTPDLFENLLQTCEHLKLLVTPCHINDVDLNLIAGHCPNLVSLDMSYSYYPTDNGVESVANGCPSATSPRTYFAAPPSAGAPDPSRALWSELTHLNIEGCQLLTDGALLALTEAKLPLTWLNYSYCLNITDAGVTHVATKCAKLQVRTHASGPPKRESIASPHRASSLDVQTLRMVGLYKITEQSVFQFIHTAHELKYLDITQCDKRAPRFPSLRSSGLD